MISGRERRFAWVAFVVLVAVCLNTGEVSASLTEASQCTKARTTSEFACQDGLDEMCTVTRNAAADICSRGPSDAQMPQIEAGVPDDAVNNEDAATDLDASHTVTVVPVATVVSIGGAENPEVEQHQQEQHQQEQHQQE